MLHCFCGVFLGYVGALYLYLVDSQVIIDFNLYSVTVNVAHFPAVAKMYFALSGIHGLLVAFTVFRSVQARRLVFRKPGSSKLASQIAARSSVKMPNSARQPSSQDINTPQFSGRRTIQKSLPLWLLSWADNFWAALRTIFAACDVRNQHYGLVFLVRELLLTSIQTYQAYRLSCLVPRLWMNNVMIGLLVFNCWATPFLQYLFRSNVAHARLGGALVNMVLDMMSYIGLPTALLVPYANDIDIVTKQFDRTFWYSDIWLIETINEVQIIFVTSFYDAISKCLVVLSVARGLYSITKLIRTADLTSLAEEAVADRNDEKVSMTSVTPFNDQAATNSIPVSRARASWESRLEKFGGRLLFLWGFFLLIVHLQAASLSDHPQCRLPIRPWFVRQPSCALLEINCAQERVTENETEIDQILSIFDPESIEHLVIRHCPQLVFPQQIKALHELLGLKVYNSTIVEWGAEAAVTKTHNPELRFLFVVDVKMLEFPIGLQSLDFPPRLRDIEFSRTNVTVIPDTLDKSWPTGMYIAFEECQLQKFPHVVLRMQPGDLALALNNFSTIPDELYEHVPLRIFSVAGNPVQSIPSTLAQPPQILWYGLISTQISELPDWMDDAFLASTFLIAGKTPLCDRLIATGQASETYSPGLLGIPGIDCSSTFMGNSSLNWYPIDIEATLNPSYSLR